MSSFSDNSSTPSIAFMTQWKGVKTAKQHSSPNYNLVGAVRRESFDLSYSFEKTVTKSTTSTATQVVSVSVLHQDEHAAYEQSDPEDWSDADDDDGQTTNLQSWFYKPAPIMIPVYKPLYVPSVSYQEHMEIIRKTQTQRYTLYHKTCDYKNKN
ncbi:hypothetical protein CJU89_6466 [Yarrowia sp. B02]|nr:hypothetical protein CJU89_6466 [Yarrowia sp. B02]